MKREELQQAVQEIFQDDEFVKGLVQMDPDNVEDTILAEVHKKGVDATVEDLRELAEAVQQEYGEIPDAELQEAAGGRKMYGVELSPLEWIAANQLDMLGKFNYVMVYYPFRYGKRYE